jgi:hypothetical protein
MSQYCYPDDKPPYTITINLRGTLFVTYADILLKIPKDIFREYEHYGKTRNNSKLDPEDRDWRPYAPPDERCYGYFIDRDPTHFHHILNFIWYNIIPQQLPEHDKLQLIEEAKFYELGMLVTALTIDVSEQAKPTALTNAVPAQAKSTSSWLPYSTKKTQQPQIVNLGGGRKKSRRRRNNSKSTRRRRHRKD